MPAPVPAPSVPATESVPVSVPVPAGVPAAVPAVPVLALVPSPDDATPQPGHLARRLQAVDRDAGMTTAEYAIGTVAACGFGGVLYKLITSETVFSLLTSVISRAFKLMF